MNRIISCLLALSLIVAGIPVAAQSNVNARAVQIGGAKLDVAVTPYDPARILFGVQGDGVTDDTTALQSYFNSCSSKTFQTQDAKFGSLILRKGLYLISSGLTAGCSLNVEPGAVIKATAAMPAMLTYGSSTIRIFDPVIANLTLDQNDLANYGLWMRRWSQGRIQRYTTANVKVSGIQLGDDSDTQTSFGTLISDFTCYRNKGTIPSGSRCLYIGTMTTDTTVNGGTPRDTDEGVVAMTGNNRFFGMHAWANSDYGVMSTCFDDYGSANFWIENEADSCIVYGFRARSTGTSFVSNNVFHNYLSDNVVVGIHFDQSAPAAVVLGNRFYSNNSSYRIAKDIDLAGPTGNQIGNNVILNVVTPFQYVFSVFETNRGSYAFGNNALTFTNGSTQFINVPNANILAIQTKISDTAGVGGVQIKSPVTIGCTFGSTCGASNTNLNGQAGELGIAKMTASGIAPNAGYLKLAVIAGTNSGTCKLIAYAGTSTTPTTIADNIGANC